MFYDEGVYISDGNTDKAVRNPKFEMIGRSQSPKIMFEITTVTQTCVTE
jgi:hypothetical protein